MNELTETDMNEEATSPVSDKDDDFGDIMQTASTYGVHGAE